MRRYMSLKTKSEQKKNERPKIAKLEQRKQATET